jgi:large repetitive protein
LWNDGNLTVNTTTVSANVALGNGGGVWNVSHGQVTIAASKLQGNTAVNGGGLFNSAGAMATLNNTMVTGNTATTDGGGVANKGVLLINDSMLDGNFAGRRGGGLFNDRKAQATVVRSRIRRNRAGQTGGGIFSRGKLKLINTIVKGNKPNNIDT